MTIKQIITQIANLEARLRHWSTTPQEARNIYTQILRLQDELRSLRLQDELRRRTR